MSEDHKKDLDDFENREECVPYITTAYSYMSEEEMARNKEKEEFEINALINHIQYPPKPHHVRNNILMFIIVVVIAVYLLYITGIKNDNKRKRIRSNPPNIYGVWNRRYPLQVSPKSNTHTTRYYASIIR